MARKIVRPHYTAIHTMQEETQLKKMHSVMTIKPQRRSRKKRKCPR